MANYFFTSESVTGGHPDKICDQISDAILDAILAEDKNGRVACECCCTTGVVMIMGEITTSAKIDIPSIARQVICDIGYDGPEKGFDGNTCAILTTIDKQSPDIALGVDRQGAGDQGMMFGYACRETPELMPMPISLAHKLAAQLTKVRVDGTLPYLRPDGKTQVTVEYSEDGKPQRIEAVVISSQHAAYIETETLRRDIERAVIREIIPADMMDENTKIFINPTGRFVTGGPHGDSGLTGRKIIVDTYGGYSRHGGGAFSGKDPTKVDRSAAYASRYVAKNIVAPALPTSALFSLRTLSALLVPYPSWSIPTEPARSPMRSLPKPSIRSLTCVRPQLSAILSLLSPFTESLQPTVTWAAPISACAGRIPTESTLCLRL